MPPYNYPFQNVDYNIPQGQQLAIIVTYPSEKL